MNCSCSAQPTRQSTNAGGVWTNRPGRASGTAERELKSHFDLLSPKHERRILAVFHSSSAVGIVLTLLALGTLTSSGPGREGRAPVHGNLFELEFGKDAGSPVDTVTSATPPVLHEHSPSATMPHGSSQNEHPVAAAKSC